MSRLYKKEGEVERRPKEFIKDIRENDRNPGIGSNPGAESDKKKEIRLPKEFVSGDNENGGKK